MKPNERVILIKGDASKWYDQAIFIVNKDLPPEKIPIDFVAEAEKIIINHMNKNRRNGPVKVPYAQTKPTGRVRSAQNKRFDFVLNMVMLMGCLAIAGVFLFGLMG